VDRGLSRGLAAAIAVILLTPITAAATTSHNSPVHGLLVKRGWESASRSHEDVSGSVTSWGRPPTISLPRRALVSFRVQKPTPSFGLLNSLPRAAGSYAGFYLLDRQRGWALLRDRAAVEGLPAEVEFGVGFDFSSLTPGHVYRLAVALEKPARIMMPIPMRVLGVLIRPLPAVAGTGAPGGSASNDLGRYPISATAIVGDWTAKAAIDSPVGVQVGTGDGCASRLPAPACDGSNNVKFWSETFGVGPDGAQLMQVVFGEGYPHPISAAYVAGYLAELPSPANATALLAFGIAPPG
jgi:hypothetical protein